MSKDKKQLSDVQCSPGWGKICVHCQYVWSDERKYIRFPPSLPCNAIEYTKGYYNRKDYYPPKYIPPMPIFKLKRWNDGSETCDDFEIDYRSF